MTGTLKTPIEQVTEIAQFALGIHGVGAVNIRLERALQESLEVVIESIYTNPEAIRNIVDEVLVAKRTLLGPGVRVRIKAPAIQVDLSPQSATLEEIQRALKLNKGTVL